MILCIAEKPSVGRDIARVLGATTSRDGYMEGNGYCVSWTFGHLCALLDPNEYNEQWKGWNMSSLPMVPERFGIKVTNDKGVIKQFNTIKHLISQATEVINCGDAGQEGELIQRWVYQKAGCRVPVKRLWISSLTEDAIREGFQKLKDQSEYQHLYEAGLMRAIGDWLLGMNATRAYTLRFAKGVGKDRQVLSIGRVQTPTLALIVKRQHEIEHFVPRTYWELKTLYRDTLFSAQLPAEEDDYAITSLEQGQKLVDNIKDLPLEITSVEKKKGMEYAPRLFDLTSLQVECNKRYGLTAEDHFIVRSFLSRIRSNDFSALLTVRFLESNSHHVAVLSLLASSKRKLFLQFVFEHAEHEVVHCHSAECYRTEDLLAYSPDCIANQHHRQHHKEW